MKTFEIKSGKVVLSDPCYDIGTWCQGVIDNVKNGTWVGVVMEKEDYGLRVAALLSYHKDYPIDIETALQIGELLNFDGGVDSGQFGHFDYDGYRNDNSVIGVERILTEPDQIICQNEPFYSICCDRTLSENWGVLPLGVVSSSGWGDGSYPTYGIKNNEGQYVAFVTQFLFDDDDFEHDGSYEEEQYFNDHPEPTNPDDSKDDLPY